MTEAERYPVDPADLVEAIREVDRSGDNEWRYRDWSHAVNALGIYLLNDPAAIVLPGRLTRRESSDDTSEPGSGDAV